MSMGHLKTLPASCSIQKKLNWVLTVSSLQKIYPFVIMYAKSSGVVRFVIRGFVDKLWSERRSLRLG